MEMFGDPIVNDKKLKEEYFVNVVKLQRGFDLPVQSREKEGIFPVIGANGIVGFHDQYKATYGIVTGRSGTIGNVYLVEGKYWPLNTTLFSIDTHGNNIIYLKWLLQFFKLERFVAGTGVPTLNRNNFHNVKIISVSIDEQNQFACFVKKIDKSKLAVQKSIDHLEILKKSLMQEYFG